MEENTESVIDSLREAMKEAEGESETLEAQPEPEDSEPVEDVEAHEPEGEPEGIEVTAEEDSEDEEPVEVFQPPEHWSSDEKETFKSLTPEAQQILLDKEKQFQKGYQERAQAISDVEKALEPYKQNLALMGVDEATAIRTLFATHARLMQDPANGILGLAQQFGVMDQLRQQFTPETDDDFTDPEIKALRAQVNQLNQQLGNFQQQTQKSQQDTLVSQINEFKSKTDDQGNPLHPYFDQVRTKMAPLVAEGKSLEEAYNEAVWLVPEFREKHLKTVESKKKAEDAQKKAEKVKRAKKASNTIKQTGGKAPEVGEKPLTLKEDLRAAWNQFS